MRILARSTRLLLLNAPRFATQATGIKVPKRWNLPFNEIEAVKAYIFTAPNCKTLAVLIKGNLELFSDIHITILYDHLNKWDIPIDEHFHSVIVPITLQWVKGFTREQAPTLRAILAALTTRNINAPQLQQAVVRKLDEQNIYKYINLRDTAFLYHSLSQHPRFINHSLFHKIQKVILEQKEYYSHHLNLKEVIQAGVARAEISQAQEQLRLQEAHKQIS